MKITQVEPQKKNPNRFSVFLDGQFAFGADEDTIVNHRLVVGKEISADDLPKLLFETEVGKLIDRMYGLFGRRQRSEKETRDYLRNLSFKRKIKGDNELSDLVIEQLVERLKQKEMINDEQFARAWVEARKSSKKRGKIALKSELFQKGIEREIVEEVLAKTTLESEGRLACEALEKKIKIWNNLPYLEQKKKALEFLIRKGFECSVAKDVVDNFLKKEYNNS